MATIILSHKVSDYKAWKKHYDADSLRREKAKLKEVYVGSKADDPNNVYIIFQTSSASAFEKMVKDPELKAVMKKAGVVGQPKVTMLK
jgi:hypothetical protein